MHHHDTTFIPPRISKASAAFSDPAVHRRSSPTVRHRAGTRRQHTAAEISATLSRTMRAPSDSERRVAQIALLDAAWLLTTRTRRGSADRRSTQIALLDGGFAVARLTAARDDLKARLQAS